MIIEMMTTILFGNETDICHTMTDLLKDKGVAVYTEEKVLEIQDALMFPETDAAWRSIVRTDFRK